MVEPIRYKGFGEALSKVAFGSACVIDSEDPLVWAEAIKKVWNKDRETRLQEAEQLRSSYKKKYSWTNQSKDLIEKMVNIANQGMYFRWSLCSTALLLCIYI